MAYTVKKGNEMPPNTMSDKELSELIYQPYHTTRKQDSLRNGATLRHYFFKELGADAIKQTMKDVIEKHKFVVYKKEDFLQELQKVLSKKDEFKDFIFTVNNREIDEKLFQFKTRYAERILMGGLFAQLPKGVDIYANNINDEHPCFFDIMHSRQSKKNVKELLSRYKEVVPDSTYYFLSFEKKVPEAYNDLEVEIFLIYDLLKIDEEKTIIVV